MNSNSFIIFYFFISYIEIDELIEKKIKREKRHNRDRIEYIKFRNFRFFTFHFIFTFTIFNVQLNQTTIFENIFDTIRLFMRRKFLTINSTKSMIWMNLCFSQLFHQKNCIYLTSNASLICQSVNIIFFFRIFDVKFS